MIDYNKLAKNYTPRHIKTLLIGEGPPPNGNTYFYLPPRNYRTKGNIEKDSRLPSTIFNHYFGKRPSSTQEYIKFLSCLKKAGIFLIDMYQIPIKFRGNKTNQSLLFENKNLKNVKFRISTLVFNKSSLLIFLLARTYPSLSLKKLKQQFPDAMYVRWKYFRLDIEHKLRYK